MPRHCDLTRLPPRLPPPRHPRRLRHHLRPTPVPVPRNHRPRRRRHRPHRPQLAHHPRSPRPRDRVPLPAPTATRRHLQPRHEPLPHRDKTAQTAPLSSPVRRRQRTTPLFSPTGNQFPVTATWLELDGPDLASSAPNRPLNDTVLETTTGKRVVGVCWRT